MRSKKRFGLAVMLVLYVFGVIILTGIIGGIIGAVLHLTGVISIGEFVSENAGAKNTVRFMPIVAIFALSALIGTTLAALLSNIMLKPVRKVISATQEIAGGNFDVRIDISGTVELEELSDSFNKMAQELSSIETLRSDFVNNFSHEFKTPIVSMRGFAKLLKDGDLSEDEKSEYLDIIITESERLSELSTNVLNLTKYENTEIVADKAPFRLDEQIRRAIVITEPKWSAKNIAINVELEEIIFYGDEDLTQQVWLNLLDNAIKFSVNGGTVVIRLMQWNSGVRFTIEDDGVGMDEHTQAHIFDKFFQGDTSHAATGNGLGLAIVKRIIELCGGTTEVKSELGKRTVFTLDIPNDEK